MKKIYFLLIGLVLFGCSSDEDNTSTTPPVVNVAPVVPSDLRITILSETNIKLNWDDNSNNETGFRIKRRTGSGSLEEVGNVGAGIQEYTDTNVTSAGSYSYKIYAYNAVGDSPALVSVDNITTLGSDPSLDVFSPVDAPESTIDDSKATVKIKVAETGNRICTVGIIWTVESAKATNVILVENSTTGGVTKTSQEAIVDDFVYPVNLTGLSNFTTYHYRAYIKNSYNTVYSDIYTFTTGKTISINGLKWSPKNIDSTVDRDGVPFVVAANDNEFNINSQNNIPTCMPYGGDAANKAIYGMIYNAAAMEKLAPIGYHVAYSYEWDLLFDFCGFFHGKILKSATGWDLATPPYVDSVNPSVTGANPIGTDEKGFSVLAGGYIKKNGIGSRSEMKGKTVNFWSLDENQQFQFKVKRFFYDSNFVSQATGNNFPTYNDYASKWSGAYVRFVKDF
jgi:uncharacterized protein (TIGR02145 family)